ncbi:MAG TPA: restriction endonuclease subunit S [Paludibacteraceae bacterium]|nr:restriction endonuclease subunit S [Paludibacteraceae bacterium]
MWVNLGEIAQHNVGKTLNKSRDSGEIREYITTSNLYWGHFDFTEIRSMSIKEEELSKCSAVKGDLLICEGGDAGRSAIWNYNYSICFQNHIHRVRPCEGFETKYLYYYMMYIYLNGNIKQYLKGVGIQSLSGTSLASIVLPLPPTNEQVLISNEIELLFEIIETIEENKVSLEDLIVQTKSKILDLAVRGKLVPQDSSDEPAITLLEQIKKRNKSHKTTTDKSHYPFEIPNGWEVTEMQNICSLLDGEKRNDLSLPYLDVKFLRNQSGINFKKSGKFVSAETNLVLVDGENSGEIFKTNINGYQGSTLKIIQISEEINEEYIFYILKKEHKLFKESKTGSAIPHLNKKLFREYPIPLPPLAEQQRIVFQIENIFAQLEIIENSLKA